MNKDVYNVSMFLGLVMIWCGIGVYSVPLALAAVGGLLILLTIYGAQVQRRNAGKANVPE